MTMIEMILSSPYLQTLDLHDYLCQIAEDVEYEDVSECETKGEKNKDEQAYLPL